MKAVAWLRCKRRIGRPREICEIGVYKCQGRRRSLHLPRGCEDSKTRWEGFDRFLGDGRIDRSNNADERALRGIAIGRKAWQFAGSDRGGERAAAIYSLITTAKLSDVDPREWLADVLARISDHPASRLDELLPWNWKTPRHQAAA